MTVNSQADAVSEMLKQFTNLWPFGVDKIDIRGRKFEPPTDETVTWCRWRIQHIIGEQSSLGGVKLWNREGRITFQLFSPLTEGNINAYNIAETVFINAYQGRKTVSDVWFRNVRIEEPDDTESASKWLQLNCYADFIYTQVKG